MRSTIRALAGSNSALRRVGASWFLVNLGEWAYVTALAIDAYRVHGALGVGLIGARFVPGALLGLVLLGAVTGSRPSFVLRLLSLGRCVTVAMAALAVAVDAPLAVLAAIVWIDAVVAAPYRPVQATILPAIAGTPRELSALAGNVPASKALAQATGALAGSLALTVVGPQWVTAAGAATFLVAGALVAPVRTDAPLLAPATRAGGAPSSAAGRFGAIASGFELIAQRARPLLLLGGTRSLTRGLWTSLTVVASIRLLGLGSTGVGILMAAAGLGAAIAMPLSLRFVGRPRLAGPAAAAFALAGIPISLVGAIAAPAPVVVLVTVWGTAFALADSISNALVHRVVEAQRLAPSVAAIESSKLLLEGLGALAAPALVAMVGIRGALIVSGALLPSLVLVSRAGLLAVDQRVEARHRPLVALRHTPSFRGLTMLSLERVAARLQDTTALTGLAVVREGDLGDRFYLIDSGRVEVTVDGFRVALLGPGQGFGDRALLRAVPRCATVTALEPSRLWYLDGPDFVAAATGNEGPVAHRKQTSADRSLEEVLDAVPLFAAIDRRRLASIGERISAPAGEEIVREGDPGDRFYVVLGGQMQATINGRPVRTLEPGDWFGEIALLHSVPRRATVAATGPVELWTLERAMFLGAVGEAASVTRSNGAPHGDVGLAGAGLLV